MLNIEQNTKAAGAYILYQGYFVFMFGFGTEHSKNELGVVRFGGHLENGETVIECITREVKEEASLDLIFYDNKSTYVLDNNKYCTVEHAGNNNPILVIADNENKFSVMFLTYGKGILSPKMETQGVLFLRKKVVRMICNKETTFKEFKEKGGKFILVNDLPEHAILTPHKQIKFLNYLFDAEAELIDNYIKSAP